MAKVTSHWSGPGPIAQCPRPTAQCPRGLAEGRSGGWRLHPLFLVVFSPPSGITASLSRQWSVTALSYLLFPLFFVPHCQPQTVQPFLKKFFFARVFIESFAEYGCENEQGKFSCCCVEACLPVEEDTQPAIYIILD